MIKIIGANGYIGSRLCNFLKEKKLEFERYSNILDEDCFLLDLTSFNEKDLLLCANDIVIVLAAISSPDVCENNYEFAYSVNVTGTSKLINYSLKSGAKVIFFSSDTVNGETGEGVRDEYSNPNPAGKYAEMKWMIEKKFRQNNNFKTLRLSYVLSECDRFTSYLKKCIDERKQAEVFDGLFRNVIKIEVVMESVLRLILNFDSVDYYLINLSGNQCLSRKDLADAYKNNIDSRLEYVLIPVPETILNGRPNTIRTKSLFLEGLVGHKIDDILKEKNNL